VFLCSNWPNYQKIIVGIKIENQFTKKIYNFLIIEREILTCQDLTKLKKKIGVKKVQLE